MTEPSSLAESRQRRIDSAIRSRVEIALGLEHRDAFCERAEFDVDVTPDGHVTLHGKVCGAESIQRAKHIARSQVGARDVRARFHVLAPPQGSQIEETAKRIGDREKRDVVDILTALDPEFSDGELSSALAKSLAAFMGPAARSEDPWFSDPVVQADDWSVDIDVDDERLRVSGAVPDEETRAAIQAWASLVVKTSERIEAIDSRALESARDSG